MTFSMTPDHIAPLATGIPGHQAQIDEARAKGMTVLRLSDNGDGVEERANKLTVHQDIDCLASPVTPSPVTSPGFPCSPWSPSNNNLSKG